MIFFWCPCSYRMVETLSLYTLNLGQIFSRQNIFKHVFFESLWKYHLPRKGLFHRTFFWSEILFHWTVLMGLKNAIWNGSIINAEKLNTILNKNENWLGDIIDYIFNNIIVAWTFGSGRLINEITKPCILKVTLYRPCHPNTNLSSK